MQTGIIKEVKEVSKPGKQAFCEVILQDDSKMTTFDKKILQAGPGDSLEFDVAINGKFINLKDGWKLTKKSSTTSEQLTKVEKPNDENRARCMALAYSKDLVVADKIEFSDLWNCAHLMEEYMMGKHKPAYREDWFMKYIKPITKPSA